MRRPGEGRGRWQREGCAGEFQILGKGTAGNRIVADVGDVDFVGAEHGAHLAQRGEVERRMILLDTADREDPAATVVRPLHEKVRSVGQRRAFQKTIDAAAMTLAAGATPEMDARRQGLRERADRLRDGRQVRPPGACDGMDAGHALANFQRDADVMSAKMQRARDFARRLFQLNCGNHEGYQFVDRDGSCIMAALAPGRRQKRGADTGSTGLIAGSLALPVATGDAELGPIWLDR